MGPSTALLQVRSKPNPLFSFSSINQLKCLQTESFETRASPSTCSTTAGPRTYLATKDAMLGVALQQGGNEIKDRSFVSRSLRISPDCCAVCWKKLGFEEVVRQLLKAGSAQKDEIFFNILALYQVASHENKQQRETRCQLSKKLLKRLSSRSSMLQISVHRGYPQYGVRCLRTRHFFTVRRLCWEGTLKHLL